MAPRTGALEVNVVATAADRAAVRGLAAWLAGVAPRGVRGAVTIALVTDARVRQLNRQFRGVDQATDVLSFPAASAEAFAPKAFAAAPPDSTSAAASARASGPGRRRDTRQAASGDLGDIAIARGVATRQARAAGHAVSTELRVLALHGLLHLLGHDHETDDGAMARLEARLRRRGGLVTGLIERAGSRR
jgi:probable rRNA maturation factor